MVGAQPDLAVSATGSVAPGGVAGARFVVTLSDVGKGSASGILLRDRIQGAAAAPTVSADSGLDCRHVAAKDGAGIYVFECSGTIAPSAAKTITLFAPVDSTTGGALVNVAIADPNHVTGDTNLKNNQITTQTLVM